MKWRRFTVKHIHYEKTLDEFLKTGEKFNIVACHSDDMSVFDIVPVSTGPDQIHWIMEECFEFVEEYDAKARSVPYVAEKHEVVLAKGKTKSRSNYQRAVVRNVHEHLKLASVYWIDAGGIETVELSSLRPVNSSIMKHPRVAYSVILADMDRKNNFIFYSDFERAMVPMLKREFTLNISDESSGCKRFFYDWKVRLTYKDLSETVDLKDVIVNLGKWNWERRTNLVGTDTDLAVRKVSSHVEEALFQLPFEIEPGRYFTAEITGFMDDRRDPEMGLITVTLVNEDKYVNKFNVLHHQIQRFAEHIQASMFFPAINDYFLIKIEDKPKYRPLVRGRGLWTRALRLNKDMLHRLDFDDIIPFEKLGEDIPVRSITKEFLSVPKMSFTLRPWEDGRLIPFKVLRSILKIGDRYSFLAIHSKPRKEYGNIGLMDVHVGLKTNEPVGIDHFIRPL